MNELKMKGMFWDWLYWLTITHETMKQVPVVLRMSRMLAEEKEKNNE